ncbi:MAG TPA: class I SAM-dependent methyltransferase [Candidatus Saccharimonadales bacterium]|nr:class I SAM-dependent methyltransferase [Candidatus Saccharimonadales bacterium]
MSTDQKTIDWYNQNAEEYTSHVRDGGDSIYHSLYEKPAMYKLLPDLKGKRVLSLGCGSGEDSHYLKQQGAKSSVGIDISEELIKIAQQSYPECEFQTMDMEKLSFEDDSFDFVFASLALHYIEDWTRVMSEVYRVLKPAAYFLFSCNHPVHFALETIKDDEEGYIKQLSITKDKKNKISTVVGNYLNRQKIEGGESLAVTTWKKPIGEIVKESTSAGFLVADIVEPQPSETMKERSLRTYQTLQKIPYFVILKLYKPGIVE